MTSTLRPKHLLHAGLFSLALVAAFTLKQQSAFAVVNPALTLDFTIGGDINAPITSATVNSASNQTETVDVWAVVTPGGTGAPDSNLGIIDFYWGATPSSTSGFSNLGSGSTTGANQGVGVTAGAIATNSLAGFNNGGSSFGTGGAAIGDWADWDINGVSKEANTKADTAVVAANSGLILGNGSDGGEALTSGGWAWLVGTMTVTLPTVSSGSATLTLTPRQSSITGINDAWTTTGSTTGAVNNQTASADALQVGSAVSFTVDALVTNSSSLNLSPSSLTFNLLQNGASTTQNLSLSETTGTSGNNASYTGVTVGNFNVNNGASGSVNAGATNTLTTSYSGNTATDGTFSGSYTVANTSGSTATQGNLSSSFTAVVGNAVTDKSGTGSFTGTVLSASVVASGSYSGLASSSNSGVKAANPNNALPGVEGSTATIMLGQNNQGATMTPSMTWRSRDLNETPANDSVNGAGWPNGMPTSPPLPGSTKNPLPLISDVVNLYGMSANSTGNSPVTTAPVQTDGFAFGVTFNPATLTSTGNAIASHGNLYLASLVPSGTTGQWENTIITDFAVAGGTTASYQGQTIQVGSAATAAMDTNTGGGNDGTRNAASGTFDFPILSSFSTWASANGVTNANIANYVGVWGVDTSGDQAWAIVDHNSEFAVVPEPSTIVLAALGLAGMAFAARKRKLAAA
jgi:hypothetical protein